MTHMTTHDSWKDEERERGRKGERKRGEREEGGREGGGRRERKRGN